MLPDYDNSASFAQNLTHTDYIALAIFVITFALILLRKFGAITLTLAGGALGVIITILFTND